MTPPRWATKEEAAQYIGVHPRTLMRWANQGRIRVYQLGDRLIRFNLTDIDQMLTATTNEGIPM